MASAISIYSLKPRFQSLLRPLTRTLVNLGVTANQVTVSACLLSIALGCLLAWQPQQTRLFLLLPGFFFFRMALNAIDGMIAREFGQRTHLGAFLNELTDVISDSFLYLPFAFLPQFSALLVGSVIVLAVVSEMTGTVAAAAGASRRYDGPMGKSDRAFVFGAVALWLGMGLPVSSMGATTVLAAVAGLLIVTIVNRARAGLAELEASRP